MRIEEMLNYFAYRDALPSKSSEHPFAVHVEIADCPWNAQHRLARIGIAAKPIDQAQRPPSNLVFLVDVSGSMQQPNKLPLVQWSLQRFSSKVISAKTTRLPWSFTRVHRDWECPINLMPAQSEIALGHRPVAGRRLDQRRGRASSSPTTLPPSTSYKNGTNRVILATDGDFNVGISEFRRDLIRLIEAKAKSGVFLSVLGYGMGNIKDSNLEKIADKGNGHYAYIDSSREALQGLVEEVGSTLVTVAKDVEDPGRVQPRQGGMRSG